MPVNRTVRLKQQPSGPKNICMVLVMRLRVLGLLYTGGNFGKLVLEL